jgi:peroxiredoxin
VVVLVAIVGALIAIDRGTGGEAGALDDRRPEIGQLAPQFALRDPEGELHSLADYRGEAVWVNFWATWCIPCREELPAMQRVAAEFEDDGLVVLAVNQEESGRAAAAFFDELGVDLPLLLDSEGDVSAQYRLFGLPASFFIDRGGILRSAKLGELSEEEMRERLLEIGIGDEAAE